VSALLKQYFDIAFLMGKPQDLPSGNTQLYVAILLNFLTYVLAMVSLIGLGSAAMHAALDIMLTSMLFYLALLLTSQLPRFQQALGAICGAGAVLNFAGIPMLQLTQTPAGQEPSALAVLSYFVLLVWSLSLVGHVLRHTFGLRMPTSIVIAVLYYLFTVSVFAAVFPEPKSG